MQKEKIKMVEIKEDRDKENKTFSHGWYL